MMRRRQGQSILEYTMVVTILTLVFFYMGTGIKRGVQSLVKVTADQIGNQQNADQDFNDVESGYMVGSNTEMTSNKYKETTELGYLPFSGNAVYATNTSFNESSLTMSNTVTNAGFVPSSE